MAAFPRRNTEAEKMTERKSTRLNRCLVIFKDFTNRPVVLDTLAVQMVPSPLAFGIMNAFTGGARHSLLTRLAKTTSAPMADVEDSNGVLVNSVEHPVLVG